MFFIFTVLMIRLEWNWCLYLNIQVLLSLVSILQQIKSNLLGFPLSLMYGEALERISVNQSLSIHVILT